jgi:hypothetical protein
MPSENFHKHLENIGHESIQQVATKEKPNTQLHIHDHELVDIENHNHVLYLLEKFAEQHPHVAMKFSENILHRCNLVEQAEADHINETCKEQAQSLKEKIKRIMHTKSLKTKEKMALYQLRRENSLDSAQAEAKEFTTNLISELQEPELSQHIQDRAEERYLSPEKNVQNFVHQHLSEEARQPISEYKTFQDCILYEEQHHKVLMYIMNNLFQKGEHQVAKSLAEKTLHICRNILENKEHKGSLTHILKLDHEITQLHEKINDSIGPQFFSEADEETFQEIFNNDSACQTKKQVDNWLGLQEGSMLVARELAKSQAQKSPQKQYTQ